MKIINEEASLLTNLELGQLISEAPIKPLADVKDPGSAEARRVCLNLQLDRYLKECPQAAYTEKGVGKFLDKIQPFGLTEFQLLLLLNWAPESPCVLSCLLAPMDLPEETALYLINLVQRELLGKDVPEVPVPVLEQPAIEGEPPKKKARKGSKDEGEETIMAVEDGVVEEPTTTTLPEQDDHDDSEDNLMEMLCGTELP